MRCWSIPWAILTGREGHLSRPCVILRRWLSSEVIIVFKTLRPRPKGRRFADDSDRFVFCYVNCCILIQISLQFVPRGPVNDITELVKIIWHQTGDRPLSDKWWCSLFKLIHASLPPNFKRIWFFTPNHSHSKRCNKRLVCILKRSPVYHWPSVCTLEVTSAVPEQLTMLCFSVIQYLFESCNTKITRFLPMLCVFNCKFNHEIWTFASFLKSPHLCPYNNSKIEYQIKGKQDIESPLANCKYN